METCDRCGKSLIGEKSVKARRKEGATSTICLDCAADLKAKRSPKPLMVPPSGPAMKPLPASKKAKKEEDPDDLKWYGHVIIGVILIGFMLVVYSVLNDLEQGQTDLVSIWWPIAVTYKITGIWGAVACPGLLSLLSFAIAIKKLLAEENE